MQDPYDANTSHWSNDRDFRGARTGQRTNRYGDIDARTIGTYIDAHPISGTLVVGNETVKKQTYFIASKLLCPSLRMCNYFFRDCTQGTHTGIDILLPKNTPILSMTAGTVIRVKQRDGTTLNEGNCVVVKAPNGFFVGYEHLESIAVTVGTTVQQGTTLGTCGKTGNASQYHLHLQVDTPDAPFHPYWSTNKADIVRWTIDPLPCLRAWSPKSVFSDLPYDHYQQDACIELKKQSILLGSGGRCFPENTLLRYEFALLLMRMITKRALTAGLPIVQPVYQPYTDLPANNELLAAVQVLQKYGIMKGSGGQFQPNGIILGEQLIAILGRLFYKLQDSAQGNRRDTYLNHFKALGFITIPRGWIGKAVPRKIVFLLLWQTLKERGHITSY